MSVCNTFVRIYTIIMNEIRKTLLIELEKLEEKHERLHAFIMSKPFLSISDTEKDLMIKQAWHMKGYINILKARIALH